MSKELFYAIIDPDGKGLKAPEGDKTLSKAIERLCEEAKQRRLSGIGAILEGNQETLRLEFQVGQEPRQIQTSEQDSLGAANDNAFV